MSRAVELYLLRHAHAGDPGGWDGPDERRPLSAKGEQQSQRLGDFLASTGFRPDAIRTSPKVRAARTAELVGACLGVAVDVDDRLAEGVGVATIEAILGDAGEPGRIVLVGHDPDFSDLAAALCGAAEIPMRKGAVARIDLQRPIAAGQGVLRWLVPPDLLKPA